MEIRRSYGRLISTMGFPILVRWHLYIESGLWFLAASGHRQPWYWLCNMDRSLSSTRRYFIHLRHLIIEKWYKMLICYASVNQFSVERVNPCQFSMWPFGTFCDQWQAMYSADAVEVLVSSRCRHQASRFVNKIERSTWRSLNSSGICVPTRKITHTYKKKYK